MSLCGVAVKAGERGRGYGKLLMRAALTEAKNAGKGIELDVDSENPTALNLYRSFALRRPLKWNTACARARLPVKNDPRTLVC